MANEGGSAHIIQGNALALPLPDASVDLVCTSPPYFGLRSYQDNGAHYDGQIGSEATPTEFLDALIAATREMVRVLKPSGSIFVNLGDKYCSVTATRRGRRPSESKIQAGAGGATTTGWNKTDALIGPEVAGVPFKSLMGMPWRYAIRCIDELDLILRAEIIWAKPNGLPESVTDRVRRSHEQWFHFTVRPRYFAAVDEIREPCVYPDDTRHLRGGRNLPSPGAHEKGNNSNSNPLGKLPGSVWTIPTQPLTVPPELGIDHFAAFPMEWPRRIIQGWSPPCGTILDPFGGTGTTALVAKALGRIGLSVDLSHDYCRLAEWRCNDRKQLERALRHRPPARAARAAQPPLPRDMGI